MKKFHRVSITGVRASASVVALGTLAFLVFSFVAGCGSSGDSGPPPSSGEVAGVRKKRDPAPSTTTSTSSTSTSSASAPSTTPPTSAGTTAAATSTTTAPIWVTAYYAAWQSSILSPSDIDYGALTHVAHFSVIPKTDGTLDATTNGPVVAEAPALTSAAHAAGKKVLVTVGGAGSAGAFRGAFADAVRPSFVSNLVAFATAHGYDGVDLDMEPLLASDATGFTALVKDLRAALSAANPSLLLTAAVANTDVIVPLQGYFDQVNVMTYDMSGPWPGWVTWHNSPLTNGGLTFASTGGALPCIDTTVSAFTAAGAARAKLGIGIDFYGYVWHGATGPDQPIAGVTVDSNVSYATIMDTLYAPSFYAWDAGAQAPYLSIPGGASLSKFVSYDDESSCAGKVSYARKNGLGGVIVWELGGGWRTSQPVGSRDALLQAIKAALTAP